MAPIIPSPVTSRLLPRFLPVTNWARPMVPPAPGTLTTCTPEGSVRPRASEYGACLWTCGEGRSGRFEDGQHGRGPAEQEQSTAVGGDVLVVAGAGAEE